MGQKSTSLPLEDASGCVSEDVQQPVTTFLQLWRTIKRRSRDQYAEQACIREVRENPGRLPRSAEVLRVFDILKRSIRNVENFEIVMSACRNEILSHNTRTEIMNIMLQTRDTMSNLVHTVDTADGCLPEIVVHDEERPFKHLLCTLNDIAVVLRSVRPSDFSKGCTVKRIQSADIEYYISLLASKDRLSSFVYKIFKPIHANYYFADTNVNLMPNLNVMSMELLQLVCLTLMQLADLASKCKEYGRALALLHLQKRYAHLLVHISGDEINTNYVFTVTTWQLAHCYYDIYTQLLLDQSELDGFDRENYKQANKKYCISWAMWATRQNPAVMKNLTKQYEITKVELEELFEIVFGYATTFHCEEVIRQFTDRGLNTAPKLSDGALNNSLHLFRTMKFPRAWIKSTYRTYSAKFAHAVSDHSRKIENIALPIVDSKKNKVTRHGDFFSQIDHSINDLTVLIEELTVIQHTLDIRVMAMLLYVKLLNYKFHYYSSVTDCLLMDPKFHEEGFRERRLKMVTQQIEAWESLVNLLKENLSQESPKLNKLHRDKIIGLLELCMAQMMALLGEGARAVKHCRDLWRLVSAIDLIIFMNTEQEKESLDKNLKLENGRKLDLHSSDEDLMESVNCPDLSFEHLSDTESEVEDEDGRCFTLHATRKKPKFLYTCANIEHNFRNPETLTSDYMKAHYFFALSTFFLQRANEEKREFWWLKMDGITKQVYKKTEPLPYAGLIDLNAQSMYYTHALAMLYKSHPKVANKVLSTFLSNYCVQAHFTDLRGSSLESPVSARLLSVTRMMFALPFLWEKCIVDKIPHGPTFYMEIIFKENVEMPVSQTSAKFRDFLALPSSDCYLEQHRDHVKAVNPGRCIDESKGNLTYVLVSLSQSFRSSEVKSDAITSSARSISDIVNTIMFQVGNCTSGCSKVCDEMASIAANTVATAFEYGMSVIGDDAWSTTVSRSGVACSLAMMSGLMAGLTPLNTYFEGRYDNSTSKLRKYALKLTYNILESLKKPELSEKMFISHPKPVYHLEKGDHSTGVSDSPEFSCCDPRYDKLKSKDEVTVRRTHRIVEYSNYIVEKSKLLDYNSESVYSSGLLTRSIAILVQDICHMVYHKDLLAIVPMADTLTLMAVSLSELDDEKLNHYASEISHTLVNKLVRLYEKRPDVNECRFGKPYEPVNPDSRLFANMSYVNTKCSRACSQAKLLNDHLPSEFIREETAFDRSDDLFEDRDLMNSLLDMDHGLDGPLNPVLGMFNILNEHVNTMIELVEKKMSLKSFPPEMQRYGHTNERVLSVLLKAKNILKQEHQTHQVRLTLALYRIDFGLTGACYTRMLRGQLSPETRALHFSPEESAPHEY